MHTLIVLCSKCKKFLDIKDGEGYSGNTHGLCPSCLKKALNSLKKQRAPRVSAPSVSSAPKGCC